MLLENKNVAAHETAYVCVIEIDRECVRGVGGGLEKESRERLRMTERDGIAAFETGFERFKLSFGEKLSLVCDVMKFDLP